LTTACLLLDQPAPDGLLVYGNTQMNQRPMDDLVTALKSGGASISYIGSPGFLPLKVIFLLNDIFK
jgi:pentafunctional AROM polypeptide